MPVRAEGWREGDEREREGGAGEGMEAGRRKRDAPGWQARKAKEREKAPLAAPKIPNIESLAEWGKVECANPVTSSRPRLKLTQILALFFLSFFF